MAISPNDGTVPFINNDSPITFAQDEDRRRKNEAAVEIAAGSRLCKQVAAFEDRDGDYKVVDVRDLLQNQLYLRGTRDGRIAAENKHRCEAVRSVKGSVITPDYSATYTLKRSMPDRPLGFIDARLSGVDRPPIPPRVPWPWSLLDWL